MWSSSGSSSSHGASRLWTVVGVILSAVLFFFLFRATLFGAQRACLRNVVRDMSFAFNSNNLEHWWDFGTLLGIVRGGDVIFSEVDADISLPKSTRQIFANHAALQAMLQELHYRVEYRDEDKMRFYGPWGWHADVDTWVDGPNNTLFMATGKHSDMSRYYLPRSWLLPTHFLGCKSNASVIPCDLRVPAEPVTVLRYWYGATWNVPRKYDKGNDPTTDWREILLWKHAVWAYDLILAFKCLIRIWINGTVGILRGHWGLAHIAGIVPYAVGIHMAFRHAQLRGALWIALLLVAACFISAFTMAAVLALQG